VVCRYIHEVEALSAAVKKLKRTVFVIHGGIENRDEVVQAARDSDDCVLFVGAQMSEGWEIPEIETMIFYSHSFSLKDYLQMKGRVQRINDLRPRCYIHLLVKDTVDEAIYKCLLNKKDFLAHIYAKKGSKTYNSI
jgi:late competence protein required for DNA uptake (superfamily II DNA/RNA helicase)